MNRLPSVNHNTAETSTTHPPVPYTSNPLTPDPTTNPSTPNLTQTRSVLPPRIPKFPTEKTTLEKEATTVDAIDFLSGIAAMVRSRMTSYYIYNFVSLPDINTIMFRLVKT